jgi:glycerol-3-phosphate dehydrogenase
VPGSTSRFVFALPATDDRVYVGLTDEEAPGPIPDVPTATEDEIDFLLSVINTALATPLTRADMLGTFSGLRPLLESGEGSTADVSRKHAVITSPDGITTIVGGKLTTYRRMAEDALDAALAKSDVKARPCRTKNLALVGAGTPEQLAAVDAPERLVRKYGLEAGQVIAEAQGDASLLEPIAEGTQITMAEMLFAVRHEGAIDEADILDRRTRIGLDPATRERAAAAATQALTQER